jgi:hypothetical protein
MRHQRVEAGPFRFRAANHIAIFMHDFVSTLSRHCAQVIKLALRTKPLSKAWL